MMGFIATTVQKALCWTADGVRIFAHGEGPYFGITWDAQHLYIGARRWGMANDEALLVYDRELRLLDTLPLPGLHQTHQIFYYGGAVYITDTGHDKVWAWRDGRLELAFWADEKLARTQGIENRHHLNGLWYDHQARRWYVCSLHGELRVLDTHWHMQEIIKLPYQLHSIYIEHGRLHTCASEKQALVILDMATREHRLVDVGGRVGILQHEGDLFQSYTRGIGRARHRWIVGCSAIQNERSARWEGKSAVVMFDDDWRYLETLVFQDTGNLHGLRMLASDRAHNGVKW